MNPNAGRRRRIAATIAGHVSNLMRGAGSAWFDAMVRELDYIEDDGTALRWALGCLRATYLARCRALMRIRWRAIWTPVAFASVLIVFAAIVLQDDASGQTSPPPPTFEEASCDLPAMTQDIRPRLRCGACFQPKSFSQSHLLPIPF